MTPPSLHSVHQAVETTWLWQDRLGEHRAKYYWVADQRSTPRLQRWHIATTWWEKAKAAYVRYQERPRHPWPSWWLAPALCVHSHEGAWTNPNYGGMGLVYQTGYDGAAGVVARSYGARYGGDLGTWPAAAQLHVAYALYTMHGWAPWPNTARMCGLL